jgi:hypothetical protein
VRITVLLLLTACAGSEVSAPAEQEAVWSDAEKCDHMCMAYCVRENMCDGGAILACRMALDHADGGTCMERAKLFTPVPQAQVEACIDAIDAMTCPAFLELYDSGKGVPAPCVGILS